MCTAPPPPLQTVGGVAMWALPVPGFSKLLPPQLQCPRISVCLPKVLNACPPGWHQEPKLPTQCPRSQMSIYPERQYLVKASDPCKAWQRLKVTPVPLQTLGFPSVSHFFPNLIYVLNPSHSVKHWLGAGGVQYGRGNAVPNMVSMEGRKVTEPLTVPTSFLAPPLIPSLRRQWTDPPSFQQLPAPSWKRPSS